MPMIGSLASGPPTRTRASTAATHTDASFDLSALSSRRTTALVFNLAQGLDCGHAQAVRPSVQHHFEREESSRAKGSDPGTLALGHQEPHLIFALGGTPPDEFKHLCRGAADASVRMAQQRQQGGGYSLIRGAFERHDCGLLHIRVAIMHRR